MKKSKIDVFEKLTSILRRKFKEKVSLRFTYDPNIEIPWTCMAIFPDGQEISRHGFDQREAITGLLLAVKKPYYKKDFRCHNCKNGAMRPVFGEYKWKNKHLGAMSLFLYGDGYTCDKCGCSIVTFDVMDRMSQKENHIISFRLRDKPDSDFVNKKNASKMLGLKQTKSVYGWGLIYSVVRNWKKLYYKPSIKAYLKNGNGGIKI